MTKKQIIPPEREEEFKADASAGMSYAELVQKYGLKNKSQANYLKKVYGLYDQSASLIREGVVNGGELVVPSLVKGYARDCERVDATSKREKDKFKQEYLKIQETELVIKDMRRKLH